MSASGNRGDDGQFIVRLYRSLKAADEPDVLVVQVDGHEGVRSAVLIAERGQRRKAALASSWFR
jgi:hypothetical protein